MYIYINIHVCVYVCGCVCALPRNCHGLGPYMLNMRRGTKYGILFRFLPFYEYSNLNYVEVPV